MAGSSFRAIVVVRVAVPLDGTAEGRDAVDEAEAALADTIRRDRGNRDAIAAAREKHERAEARHLKARAALARQAERETVVAIKDALVPLGVATFEATVEVVEETG